MYVALFSERMKYEMDIRGWSKEYVAEKADVPVETIRNIYYKKTQDIKMTTAIKICDVFGLSVNCMVGKCPHTPEERAIIHNYRACGKHGKSRIELAVRYEAGAVKSEREGKGMHKIPCLCPQGDMHKGVVYDLCETIDIDTNVPNAYISLQMPNNDFAPLYCKGDVLLFEDKFPLQNEVAAFLVADRLYIRKFFEEGGIYRLKCLHRYGEDIVLKRMDEVDYIGTCIGVVRS